MAGLDTKIPTRAPADLPVFVAGDSRRARRLRNAAIVVGVLAALWVVGLGVGMLGFGHLPGIALVKGAQDSGAAHAPSVGATQSERLRRVLAVDVKSIRGQSARSAAAQRVAARAVVRHTRPANRGPRPPAVTPPPTSAQTPANPSERARGWARRGYTAPRGQLRKAAPPPPAPVTSRGRRVGHTLPATPPRAPAGQAKKALQPPPPPPPPPKKG